MQRKTVNYKWLINSANIITEMHSYGMITSATSEPPATEKDICSQLKAALISIPSKFAVNMQCLYKYTMKFVYIYIHTQTEKECFIMCIYKITYLMERPSNSSCRTTIWIEFGISLPSLPL